MPKTMPTGSEISTYLRQQAQRRADLLAEVSQIDNDVFAPLGMDPTKLNGNAPKRQRRSSGKRAPRGAQTDLIQKLLESNGGRITTRQAIDAFDDAKFSTAANAVLMRLKKQGMIANPARGVWALPGKAKKSAAKA